MPSAGDRDGRFVAQLRHDGAARAGEVRLRGEEVERGQDLDVRVNLESRPADVRRQGLQDALHLALFFDLQRADAIVALERRERLDEERLSARAGVVNDARERAGELRFDRYHKAPVANRNDPILNYLRVLRTV